MAWRHSVYDEAQLEITVVMLCWRMLEAASARVDGTGLRGGGDIDVLREGRRAHYRIRG